MKKHYIESTKLARITKPTAKIQSNTVINHKGSLKYFTKSCKSFIIKILSFYVLKSVRSYLKGNLRSVIIVGSGSSIEELKNIFTKKKELGYSIKAIFSDVYNKRRLPGAFSNTSNGT